jgi:hypothetical protein
MSKRSYSLLMVAGLAVAISGCYKTVIYDGSPQGHSPVQYDSRWHHGVVYGLVELPSSGHLLDEACPGGWSRIQTKTSFLNGLVESLTWSLYNPQTVSITCSAGYGQYEVELGDDGEVIAIRPIHD